MTQRYGCGEDQLAHYTAHRIDGPIAIDGNLDKEPWRNAAQIGRAHV